MLPSANYHEKKFKLLLSILLNLVARSNVVKLRLNTLTQHNNIQNALSHKHPALFSILY